MQQTYFMLLTSFFLLSSAHTNPPSTDIPDFHCGLPAPKNIHIEVLGGYILQLGWDPVPGAAFYKAYIYRSGQIIQQRLVVAHPSKNYVFFDDYGDSNISYVIKSVCANNMESDKTK